MEVVLGKLTQHAMNYAIRSGIAVTSTYAIKQCSRLLKTVDNSAEFHELQNLQERLDSKIRIISPAIDMIELISARGNTSLESAVSLTKALRWDIQSLAIRLAKAASAEEESQRTSNRVKSRPQHEAELRFIVQDIRKLLLRIEDAVPLINLAITTSGASLSTSLPATVSPSRLLQASTFLTAGDTDFSMDPNTGVQVGPAFILSVYMLFSGHAYRAHVEEDGVRNTTWKEVIHKARVKLIRVPLAVTYGKQNDSGAGAFGSPSSHSIPTEVNRKSGAIISGEGKASEFAYRLEIIEDLDDNRYHSFEDDGLQPGPYKDVLLAGIRELVPIHEVSKIFYADTGKILNIGSEGETNSPVLLLKRDVNALPPRRMMEHSEQAWYQESEKVVAREKDEIDETQTDIDTQLHRESSVQVSEDDLDGASLHQEPAWNFPPDLDPEWLAFEVYAEAEDESSGDEQEVSGDSTSPTTHRPSQGRKRSSDSNFTAGLANLHLGTPSPRSSPKPGQEISAPAASFLTQEPTSSPFGPIRSSLSLLEMLIRLTALQQFQQASHLSIPDELLTFFLEESSTTGAGGDGQERRRKRHDATRKVGFDPYDESPVKRRGEDYQYGRQQQDGDGYGNRSRSGTPQYDDYDGDDWQADLQPRSRYPTNAPSQLSPSPWHRSTYTDDHPSPSPHGSSAIPSSPQSPQVPAARRPTNTALNRVQVARAANVKAGKGSPLGSRGGNSADVRADVDVDSSLGTSPGMPESSI